MPRLLYANPGLRARNVGKLAEWYRDALGFEIRFVWQDPPTFAMVGRDAIRLAIGPADGAFGPGTAYIHVEGVDALYAEFLDREVAIHRPIEVTDYGMKDFDVYDPDGNRLCFGETVERVPRASTARPRKQTTGLRGTPELRESHPCPLTEGGQGWGTQIGLQVTGCRAPGWF